MKHALTAILVMAFAANWCSAQRRERSRDRERTSSAAPISHSNTGEFAQDYSIFGDLNIFQRERHVKRAPGSGGPPPRTPEQTYVLTGIVQDLDNVYRANFEDLSRGGVQKVSVGSPLARGTISDIQQDQVAYNAGDKKVWVQIGHNLTGSSANISDSPTSNDGDAAVAVDPNAPGLSIEQRMRARRMALSNGGSAVRSGELPAASPVSSSNVPQFSAGGSQPLINSRPGQNIVDGPPQSGTAQNDATPGSPTDPPAADSDEPVINHNFPPLPAVPPGQGQ